MRAFLMPIPFILVLIVSGCGFDGKDLTPKQQVFDLASKYEPIQIAIEEAVSHPLVPPNVKHILRTFDKAAVAALKDYREAVERQDPNLAAYISAALQAINEATFYLESNSLMGKQS